MTDRRRMTLAIAVLCTAGPAHAWHGKGHHRATRLAAQALEAQMPDFFTHGAATVAHCALDPDSFKEKALPQLRDREYPEHYIDLELLEGATLPATRYEFLALCRKLSVAPKKVGLLPYAVVEHTQQLVFGLAEHRKWPTNPHVRAKCLVYAGLLAHYAQDLVQPLHTTIYYDGRFAPGGESPRSGIHMKVDALIAKVHTPDAELLTSIQPTAYPTLTPAVVSELTASHKLVDAVYRLEAALPAHEAPLVPASQAESFAEERLKAAARFTASLYLTAWRLSGTLELPDWFVAEREATEKTRDAETQRRREERNKRNDE